ncbi:MAG TPA: sugar ABC transporter permease [Firmicutes bacterium]|jgi:multiple sugar transport system permease protein/sn-glycerol 3-phosphate transport system permease protein|nr:sugar ABC transporter permease [Bacillota bacterium]HBK69008.1 sugar ABC transporter permease [Bacillota bacterium]
MGNILTPTASTLKPRTSQKQRWRQWVAGYLMILPNLLGFLIFMLIPIISTVVLGFTKWDLVNIPQWVGIANYKNLFGDRIFWLSFKKTIWFTLLNVPIQSFLALLVAVLLNRKLRALNLFRTLFIIPWICMPVAVGLTWIWLFNTQFGYINHVLINLGLERIGWLTSGNLALYAVLFVNIWQYLGWHIILLLAGLQIVPQELYEAATVDGANNWINFWKITIPMISPIFFYDLVVNMIMTMQIFDLPFAMTNGGPGNATRVFNLYLYQKGFSFLQMGEACSMGVILFILIIIATFLLFRFLGSRVNYDMY